LSLLHYIVYHLCMTGKEVPTSLEGLDDADEDTRLRITEELREAAETDPERVLEEVPLIGPHLDDQSKEVRENLLVALGKVAQKYPEEVLPLVSKLEKCASNSVEEQGREETNTAAAQFALGMVAKEYPNVAVENLPRFAELTEVENRYVSTNAMALLGDLADEYRDEVAEYLPRAIEELDAEDKRMRCNALLVVTRIAKDYPEKVEQEAGIDGITEMLNEDLERTRDHACWALMYLGDRAEEAAPEVKTVAEDDSSERVREVAGMALDHIEDSRDWRV
jgi:HEAT repeat protein